MTLQERVEELSISNLKACAKALFNNHEDGSDEAFQAVINELEKQMPEAEFIIFLDSDLQSE